MQASEMATIVDKATTQTHEVSAEAQETAARMSALMRHVFLYDRGNQLRVIEESGLSMTQCKAVLELGGMGQGGGPLQDRDLTAGEPLQVSDLAEHFGVSVPSMSRAVDALVKKKLVSRVEDPNDRRVRRVAITAKGKQLVDTILLVRQAGLQAFVESLSPAQRRKIDAAVDALMDDRPDIAETFEHLKGV